MKHSKTILCVLLCLLLLVGSIPVFAADNNEENTPKEEVVYVNLNGDGSVKDITVVNAFDLDSDGKIIDYGAYESVRNMTTTDKIQYSGNKVTVNAKAGKLYYEGKLSSDSLPWKLDIRYFMDGKEGSAEEIAGKSGHLKITLDITQNADCIGNFFDGYALQTTLTLDSEKCKNIVSENATVANVGTDKQLSYIILPGKGANLVVEADVTDFEMDGISVNGVRLQLSLSVDQTGLQEQIDELTDAVKKLDDGAGDLNSGTGKLRDATGTLKDNTGKLHDGVGQIVSGSQELTNGLTALDAQSGALVSGAYAAFEGLCEVSGAVINAELRANGMETVTLTPENYTAVLNALLAQMDADAVYRQAYNAAKAQVTAAVEAQADALYAGYIQQNSDAIIDAYVASQADSIYTEVARQAVAQRLTEAGMREEQAAAYLQTAEGQALVEQTKAALTNEQKAQILADAKASLTQEQKQQILDAALLSLTEEQKAQIRDGYIEQQMSSDAVTAEIAAAVQSVNAAAGQMAQLKGKLDQYAVFYKGVQDYTVGVASAKNGSAALTQSLQTLFSNTDTLNKAVIELDSAVRELYDGTKELKNGTEEFRGKTSGLSEDVDEEISSILAEVTGSDVRTGSFVSEKNTNIQSVQFVMKTDGVTKAETQDVASEAPEKLTFWQKLLRLFGLY